MVCFQMLTSVPLIYMSKFIPVPQTLDYCGIIGRFKLGKKPNFVLLFHDYFGYSALLTFLYKILVQFVSFYKMVAGIYRDWIKSVDEFGKHCCLNNIGSSSPEHRMSFHFIQVLSNFFQHVCSFIAQVLCFFVEFIPKYVILFDAILMI